MLYNAKTKAEKLDDLIHTGFLKPKKNIRMLFFLIDHFKIISITTVETRKCR
jgi:hypothetical protein